MIDISSHQPDVTSLSTLEEAEDEEDDEPLVKSEDDIPKGCWWVGKRRKMSRRRRVSSRPRLTWFLEGLASCAPSWASGPQKRSTTTSTGRTSSGPRSDFGQMLMFWVTPLPPGPWAAAVRNVPHHHLHHALHRNFQCNDLYSFPIPVTNFPLPS